MADDDSYKLPLRQWLVKQIDSGMYLGLEWELGSGKTTFRLPWEKKHGVEWKEKHKLFEAWAKHRKGTSYTEQDPSKLKANFRSALNKSESFVEVTGKNQLHNQCGNYKVYRILTPAEVEEKKKNLKRKVKKENVNSGQLSIQQSNFNSLEIQAKKERISPPMNPYQNGYNHCNGTETGIQSVQSDFGSPNLEMSPYGVNHSNWLDDSNDTLLRNEFSLAGPSQNLDNCWEDQSMNIKLGNPLQNGVSHALDNPLLMQPESTNLVTINASAIQQQQSTGSESFLNSMDLETFENALPVFDIEIYYDGVLVKQHPSINLAEGLRMHYGANINSKAGEVIQKYNTTAFKSLYEMNLPDIEFPKQPSDGTYLAKILEGLRLGFTMRYLEKPTFKLSVTRFCQTHIFVANINPHKKVEREVPTDAFDLAEYLKVWNLSEVPSLCLACGVKPRSDRVTYKPEKGVWVKFKPCVGEIYKSMPDEQRQSICMSHMNDLEKLLHSLQGVSLNSRPNS